MEPNDLVLKSEKFDVAHIQCLKQKYSQEMKDVPDNPIKICMKLIFESAAERNPVRRLELAQDLSRFLTSPNGVINLFLAIIDFDASSQKTTTHNQRFLAVSNIITHLPKLCMPYEDYCKNIAQQLRPLLIFEDAKYSSLACIIFKSLLESPHAKDKEKVADNILRPTFDALLSSESLSSPSQAIMSIHNLALNHFPTKFLVRIFPNLFYCLTLLKETPSRLRTPLKVTLINILNDLDAGVACCLIEKTLFHSQNIVRFYAKSADDEEISVRVLDTPPADTEIELDPEIVKTIVVDLLENGNNELLILEFFFHFMDTMCNSKDSECGRISASLIQPLLDQTIREESTKLDLLSIIATNTRHSLNLISRTLLNQLALLRHDQNSFAAMKTVDPCLSSCINILEVLAVTMIDEDDKSLLNEVSLPVLRELRVQFEKSDQVHIDDSLYRSLDSLVKRLESNVLVKDDKTNEQGCAMSHEYDSIMKDLNDRLVPVRVHALVRLKQLILANNHYFVSRIPQLFINIESLLSDPEPYVFLASINLVTEMAVRRTEEILPKLKELYTKEELNVEHRVTVGEVLVRLIKQLNSTAPYYAQQVINMLFEGCKNREELIRVSSLTNLGELCKGLGDTLGKYVIEILECVQVAIRDDAQSVKCASIDLLRNALSGLDGLRAECVQRELKDFYGLLKRLRNRSLDERLCLQVDLALDEVDRLARELLGLKSGSGSSIGGNEKDRLVKNIKVLSLNER